MGALSKNVNMGLIREITLFHAVIKRHGFIMLADDEKDRAIEVFQDLSPIRTGDHGPVILDEGLIRKSFSFFNAFSNKIK